MPRSEGRITSAVVVLKLAEGRAFFWSVMLYLKEKNFRVNAKK